MILCTTIRALVARNSNIYKLTCAEHTFTYGPGSTLRHVRAASVEFYASMRQALKAQSDYLPGIATISQEPADMDKHYMRT